MDHAVVGGWHKIGKRETFEPDASAFRLMGRLSVIVDKKHGRLPRAVFIIRDVSQFDVFLNHPV